MEQQKNIKIYPNNFEAEKSVLCCIMIDGQAASDILSFSENCFYNERNRRVFLAAKSLHTTGRPVDMVTLYDELENTKKSDIDMLDYLSEVNAYLPSAANFKEYISILVRDMLMRALITACNEIIEEAYFADDAAKILNYAAHKINEIDQGFQRERGNLEHIHKAADEFFEKLNALSVNKASSRGLLTYFNKFDRITNGLQKGDLIILAARPSVGKTSFALNIVANQIENDKSDKVIAIFSLEMPAVQLAQRIFSMLSDASMKNLSSATLADSQLRSVWDIKSKMANFKIYVDDGSYQTPTDINTKLNKLRVKEGRIDLVIIDYLQLMDSDRAKNRRNDASKATEVGEISKALKIMAREMNCPVIALSQMSRGIESRDDKMPKLSDLRESGAIEQDADIVMFLSLENEEQRARPEYNVILDIVKHRNGEKGELRYDWHGTHVKFLEAENQNINRELQQLKKQQAKY
jgi:replicative DNA helicase